MMKNKMIRDANPNEIFESRIEYFVTHQDNFTQNQVKFLNSILKYKSNIGITKKQIASFINIVDTEIDSKIRKQ